MQVVIQNSTESQAWRNYKTIQAVIPNIKIVQNNTKVIVESVDELIVSWLKEYYNAEVS